MDQNNCPNLSGCKLVLDVDFLENQELKQHYIIKYCQTNNSWEKCRRYQTKIALNFCPDFVLPDSNFTIDEILDKFED